jgi:hypothetical protein
MISDSRMLFRTKCRRTKLTGEVTANIPEPFVFSSFEHTLHASMAMGARLTACNLVFLFLTGNNDKGDFSCPQRKESRGIRSGELLDQDLVPVILPIAQHRQSQCNFSQRNWNILGHHHAWSTCFVEYPTGQYPIILSKCAPVNVGKQRHWVFKPKYMSLWNYPQKYQPKR